MFTLHFDHVGIGVPSIEAASDWYQQALGMRQESVFSVPGADLRGAMLVHPQGFRIELLERAGSRPGPGATDPDEAALTQGFGHLCLRAQDVDAAFAHLVSAGALARREPRPSPRPGYRFAWVSDPFGNLIEVLDR